MDGKSTVEIFKALEESRFEINPSMLATYEAYFAGQEWSKPKFGGGILPEYASVTYYNDPAEKVALNLSFVGLIFYMISTILSIVVAFKR